MAGHSKWKNIKHKKAAADAIKAKKFTKLLKEITVCARERGGDLASNPTLRTMIQKAHEINMPKENYTRAIKRGTGEIAGNNYESFLYEGYGPCGIAVILDVLSDNKNRAAAEIRAAFSHNRGTLGESGAVNWMFEKTGIINFENNNFSDDDILNSLIENNIDDVIDLSLDEETKTGSLITSVNVLNNAKECINKLGITIDEAIIGYYPKSYITLSSEDMEKASQFLSVLDDLEDVQHVFSNI